MLHLCRTRWHRSEVKNRASPMVHLAAGKFLILYVNIPPGRGCLRARGISNSYIYRYICVCVCVYLKNMYINTYIYIYIWGSLGFQFRVSLGLRLGLLGFYHGVNGEILVIHPGRWTTSRISENTGPAQSKRTQPRAAHPSWP